MLSIVAFEQWRASNHSIRDNLGDGIEEENVMNQFVFNNPIDYSNKNMFREAVPDQVENQTRMGLHYFTLSCFTMIIYQEPCFR